MPLEEPLNLGEPTVSHHHLDEMARGVHGEVGCHGRLYPPASGFLHPVTSYCMSSATSLPSPIKQLNEAPPQDSRISHSVYFFLRSSIIILLAPASLLRPSISRLARHLFSRLALDCLALHRKTLNSATICILFASR